MKYLSFDIEATGLEQNDYMIEFAMIPFDTEDFSFNNELKKHFFIKCPSFEELKPNLNPWVIEHNQSLITKAHEQGISLEEFKIQMSKYLESSEVKTYFNNKKIILFGKSMSSIDLPFLNRDLGWEYMRKYFSHQQLDLSSIVYSFIDLKKIPPNCSTGSKLMKYFNFGEVAHTALEDAISTAKMYFEMIKLFKES